MGSLGVNGATTVEGRHTKTISKMEILIQYPYGTTETANRLMQH